MGEKQAMQIETFLGKKGLELSIDDWTTNSVLKQNKETQEWFVNAIICLKQ